MFTKFVNMMIVKFPPYLRCSIVILDSSGAFPFLKVEMHSLSSSSVELKKKLRSAQRRLAAAKRDNTYTRIMNLNEQNDKQLFALFATDNCV
jgi:hypothetical protein